MHYFKKSFQTVWCCVFIFSCFFLGGFVIAQTDEELMNMDTVVESEVNTDIVPDPGLLYDIPNINQTKVQEAWLRWVNTERENMGSPLLTGSTGLTKTAILRSENLASKNKFSNMHQRPGCPQSRCTNLIAQWFQNNGIEDNASESVGRGSYKCNKEDCTDDFIKATRKRFDGLFMGEKKSNGVHYRMMISSKYSKVGFGFALAKHPKRGQQYILVMHISD